MAMTEDPDDNKPVEVLFRNGNVTVMGIIIAFSLGFVTQWAANPVPWNANDTFAIAPMVTGIVLQLVALWSMLRLRSLQRPVFRRANATFMTGLVLTSLGVVLAVAFDVMALSATEMAVPAAGMAG
jgi:magnesium-transporting ATPase (P-type)